MLGIGKTIKWYMPPRHQENHLSVEKEAGLVLAVCQGASWELEERLPQTEE